MEKSTSWVKDGHKFETFKDKKNGVTRILVKKNGSPNEIIKISKTEGIKYVVKRN